MLAMTAKYERMSHESLNGSICATRPVPVTGSGGWRDASKSEGYGDSECAIRTGRRNTRGLSD